MRASGIGVGCWLAHSLVNQKQLSQRHQASNCTNSAPPCSPQRVALVFPATVYAHRQYARTWSALSVSFLSTAGRGHQLLPGCRVAVCVSHDHSQRHCRRPIAPTFIPAALSAQSVRSANFFCVTPQQAARCAASNMPQLSFCSTSMRPGSQC